MNEVNPRQFLHASKYVDFEEQNVALLAQELASEADSQESIVKTCFEYVRDNIKHSWDYKQNPVTIKASDVLKYGTGYCYAKSHLLAALLRANGIPAALCYQRLTITDQPPYCLHGLNAVFLESYGWHRLDARGNKPGIHAEFAPPLEKLAYPLVNAGEQDIPGLYAYPLPQVIEVLEASETAAEVYDRLVLTDVEEA